MGQCKRCGKIYGAFEMQEGICKKCLTPEDLNYIERKRNKNQKNLQTYKLKKIYKIAIFSIIIGIVSIPAMFLLPISNLFTIVILISLLMGHLLLIFIIFKYVKDKVYTISEIISIIIPLSILDFLIYSLSNANWHA